MSKNIIPLTADRLRELLYYNPETGVFVWRVQKGRRLPGDRAGHRKSNGYVEICIDQVVHYAHRLAWLLTKGCWPTDLLDHRNGVRHDNHIDNLREANNTANNQNQRRASKNNKLGLLGVSRHKSGRYIAFICVARRTQYLGLYDTPEAAHAAYVVAKQALHPAGTL